MEIKTKFDLGDDAFKIESYSGIHRPTILLVGTVVGYQITKDVTEAIIRYSGTDKPYSEDGLLTKTEVNECWSNLMGAYIKELKRELADCENELEEYEKWKSK